MGERRGGRQTGREGRTGARQTLYAGLAEGALEASFLTMLLTPGGRWHPSGQISGNAETAGRTRMRGREQEQCRR